MKSWIATGGICVAALIASCVVKGEDPMVPPTVTWTATPPVGKVGERTQFQAKLSRGLPNSDCRFVFHMAGKDENIPGLTNDFAGNEFSRCDTDYGTNTFVWPQAGEVRVELVTGTFYNSFAYTVAAAGPLDAGADAPSDARADGADASCKAQNEVCTTAGECCSNSCLDRDGSKKCAP